MPCPLDVRAYGARAWHRLVVPENAIRFMVGTAITALAVSGFSISRHKRVFKWELPRTTRVRFAAETVGGAVARLSGRPDPAGSTVLRPRWRRLWSAS